MTQEEKELLLKDLCARLPYDVMGSEILNNKIWGLPELLLNVNIEEEKVECSDSLPYSLENFRPYLRTMSSMTEEEKREYTSLCNRQDIDTPTWSKIIWHDTYESIDWLNKNMFDYRGLIPMGLALEAPEGMYNIKNK